MKRYTIIGKLPEGTGNWMEVVTTARVARVPALLDEAADTYTDVRLFSTDNSGLATTTVNHYINKLNTEVQS